MGQAKLPAVCAVCQTKGPRRREALKEGWGRLPFSMKNGQKNPWGCPTCLEKWKAQEAQRRRKEAQQVVPPHRRRSPLLAYAAALALSGRRLP